MDKEIKSKTGVIARIIRFALVSVGLCVVMGVSYSLYGGKFAEILTKMENSNNTMTNMIWLYKHAVNILPCILVLIVQALAYLPEKDKKLACKERKWQMLIVFIFVYLFIFGSEVSGGMSEVKNSAIWFATQLIPIIILSMYYSQRQGGLDDEVEIHPDEQTDIEIID